MNRHFKNSGLLILSLLLFVTACSTKRKAALMPLENAKTEFVLAKMYDHRLICETFQTKASVNFKSAGNELDVTINLRIHRDSLIWASISPLLGIESTRILISRDSVFIIDRFNKTYMKTGIDFLRDYFKVNVDLEIIQNLLLGNDFEQYSKDVFDLSIESGQYRLSTANRQKIRRFVRNNADADRAIFQDIWLNAETFKIEEMIIREIWDVNTKMRIRYSDFKDVEGSLMPTYVRINITRPEKAEVIMDLKKTILNDSLSFPFSIPSNYSRIYY